MCVWRKDACLSFTKTYILHCPGSLQRMLRWKDLLLGGGGWACTSRHLNYWRTHSMKGGRGRIGQKNNSFTKPLAGLLICQGKQGKVGSEDTRWWNCSRVNWQNSTKLKGQQTAGRSSSSSKHEHRQSANVIQPWHLCINPKIFTSAWTQTHTDTTAKISKGDEFFSQVNESFDWCKVTMHSDWSVSDAQAKMFASTDRCPWRAHAAGKIQHTTYCH